jgi:hypothetical protein
MERVRMLDGIGGKVEYSDVTASYADLFSPLIEGRVVIIVVVSTLDVEMELSFDGGTTTFMYLPPGGSLTLDLGANGLEWSGTLSARATSTLPTSGMISVGIIRAR